MDDKLISEYSGSGAFEVWRSWRDTMLSQDREVADKFMSLPIPAADMALDAQIANDVVKDFLIWAEEHHNLRLTNNKSDLGTIELLSRTQQALAGSDPIRSEFSEGKGSSHYCIHCGADLDPTAPPIRQNHNQDCIWLRAVVATGDYNG